MENLPKVIGDKDISFFVVWLIDYIAGGYYKTTRQQDDKSVWKTVPSEARVTRDEVSGL